MKVYYILTLGIDWKTIQYTNPPFEPELVNLNVDKSKTVPLEDIFDVIETPVTQASPNHVQGHNTKINSKHIDNVRLDILHEENLNGLVEIAYTNFTLVKSSNCSMAEQRERQQSAEQ